MLAKVQVTTHDWVQRTECVLPSRISKLSDTSVCKLRTLAYYATRSNNHPHQLYLDERHIDWMSDRILQHVLVDLRPLSVYLTVIFVIASQAFQGSAEAAS